MKKLKFFSSSFFSVKSALATLISLSVLLQSGCAKDELTDKKLYEKIAYTIILCLDNIYSQNIAGQPGGAINKNVTGPMGGNVNITGSVSHSPSTGLSSTDLIFSMQNVPYTYTGTGSTDWKSDLVLSGDITYKGTYSSTNKNLSHLSSSFTITGSVEYESDNRTIANTGNVTINITTQTNGNIFGNTFS